MAFIWLYWNVKNKYLTKKFSGFYFFKKYLNMRKITLLAFLFITFISVAQIPAGYYTTATGTGYTLKTQLKTIITNGHIDRGYNSLNNEYVNTDVDNYYENDGSILDMYSENNLGTDPYNYNFSSGDECGNYNSEADCYNKEHIFPQGFFDSKLPMRSDIHHVPPTDGRVNGFRSNYMFGVVGTNLISQSGISNPTQNGSKLGNCISPGYSGTVFEPIDEFKGDIARMLLYFAVRYEDNWNDSGWDAHTVANNPLNGTSTQFYETWYINLLYDWHTNDAVNQREIDRNNAAYTYQGNRNPFIDHPEWVSEIWGNILAVEDYVTNNFKIHPNPTYSNTVYIDKGDSTVKQLELYSISGKLVLSKKIDTQYSVITLDNLDNVASGMYLLKIYTDKNSVVKKLVIN